jgi:putative toxin-antitoxin system antitoxin component (TIGR02293 family)
MYPVEVAKVAAALGGTRTLRMELRSLGELTEAVARGFPRGVVRALAMAVVPGGDARGALRRQVEALVASPATLKRNARLSPAASERAERLARIAALATQALGTEGEAKAWLTEAHPLLGNRPPIEVAATDLGARQVERMLVNIEYGLPA